MAHRALAWLLLGVILGGYGVLGWRYAVLTPAWQVPDEPAHYNYIRQIAEEGRLPVIRSGDWDSAYQSLLTSTRFHPDYLEALERIEYGDHHPPLYYLLLTPVFLLSDGDLTALRLASVAVGAGAVLLAFLVIGRLFPQRPWLALTGAAFVAFVPQNLSILSGVSNDGLAQVMVGLGLLASLHYLHLPADSDRHLRAALWMGLAVGLAFLTKTTVYFIAGVAGLALLLKWRRSGWPWRLAGQQIVVFLVPALVMGGAWWARNLSLYGGTDFLGLQRHAEVAGDQLRTEDYLNDSAFLNGDREAFVRNFGTTTYNSFWGQFGWMAVPMTPRDYRILLIFCGVVGLGLVLALLRADGWRAWASPQREGLVLMTVVAGLVVAAYLFYNLEFYQAQGRYLFPALIPLGLMVGLGLSGWASSLAERLRVPALHYAPLVAMLLLAAFAFYALQTYIVPNLGWQ
ncbi:MAG: glycosyltransferase family 39 protein [Anaerolineae bacterium]|nr:glycosyltransferase family 39 protein [Anaerolineae bacterium]